MKNIILLLLAIGACAGCSMLPKAGFDDYANIAAAPVLGYGPVNYWADADPQEWAKLLYENNCRWALIEFAGWAASNHYDNPDDLADPYRRLVKAMRQRKITLHVSIVNDNKGSGKYGDDRRGLDKFWPQMTRMVQIIRDEGPEGVVIQPTAEGSSSTARKFEQYCLANLPGFTFCWNWGSRPGSTPAGYAMRAIHPSSVKNSIPRGAVVISDHSIMLRELGGLYSFANPNALKAYAVKCLQAGASFGYYGFGHQSLDENAIEALGEVAP